MSLHVGTVVVRGFLPEKEATTKELGGQHFPPRKEAVVEELGGQHSSSAADPNFPFEQG
jgi:hypothetical protein